MSSVVPADALEVYLAKFRQLRFASHLPELARTQVPLDTCHPSSVLVGPTGGVTPPRVLLDPGLSKSIFVNPTGGVTPLRVLLDPCLSRSIFVNSALGGAPTRAQTCSNLVPKSTRFQTIRHYRVLGSITRPNSPIRSSRAVFDSRIVGSASRHSSPISNQNVAAIFLSTRLIHGQPCFSISCGDLLHYFN